MVCIYFEVRNWRLNFVCVMRDDYNWGKYPKDDGYGKPA